jgi:hypothetical protein
VGELYDVSGSIFTIDNGKQSGASRQYRFDWIFWVQIHTKLRNWSCLKFEREQLGEFLDAEGALGHLNKLE